MDPPIIFLCLLFATNCMSLPTNPIDVEKDLQKFVDKLNPEKYLQEFLDKLGNGTNIQKEIIGNVDQSIGLIDTLLFGVEKRLAALSSDMEVVGAEKIKIVNSAYETYRKSKLTLRIARNKLRRLAHKTILTTDDLIIYMDGWDKKTPVDEQKEYLEEQIKIMKNLVEESKDILEDAETTYNQAYDDLDSVIFTLETFKNGLKKGEENLREGAYATAGVITAAMIIADIFGCLGLCSAIVTTTTWTTTIPVVESKMAELQQTMDDNVDDLNHIIKQTKNLRKFIQKETLIIIEWDDEVDRLSGKLHYVKEENFYRLQLKRDSLTNSLKGLRNVAQEFFDRPEGVFGKQLV